MRNLVVLLFGGIGLLLATAFSAPAYAQQPRPDLATLHLQARHVHVDVAAAPVAAEQVGVAQLAAVLPDERRKPHPERFYTRWRRVHGRWYQFTFRRGERRAMVTTPELGWRSRLLV
ncbi:hypothetical protein [Hymenobacter canadensis]|uniref:Uncharacterized protein n=1 Tax=Hymenobacter canadensis TaxID=2999067 RepID=A0ABY7LRF2_9BACT|nr:hypothetical protein [Hymenobacter canadensis]WBA42995.1 hypothetical protein O3303_05375 [Hymenobacter canadensis]